jgi:hypothetical protein
VDQCSFAVAAGTHQQRWCELPSESIPGGDDVLVMLGTRKLLKPLSRSPQFTILRDYLYIVALEASICGSIIYMGCLESHERVGAIHQERSVK